MHKPSATTPTVLAQQANDRFIPVIFKFLPEFEASRRSEVKFIGRYVPFRKLTNNSQDAIRQLDVLSSTS
jgi:hypothetical protein